MAPELPGQAVSLWLDNPDRLGAPPLDRDVEADVCVCGAGITGLTAALELARAGRRVVVLDMHEVGAGVSGNTTAKLTSLHQTVYAELRRKFGRSGAATYAAANEDAIARVANLVAELGVDCGFRRRSNYTYTESQDEVLTLEKEAEAAQDAGLSARFVKTAPLPFGVKGAVVLDQQAEFDPHPYLLALAREIQRLGGAIHEHTTATHVGEGSRPEVKTQSGRKVKAGDVIVATHYPFLDRGVYFPRLTPKRSYAIAARPAGPVPEGMFINVEQPTRSIRAHRTRGGEELLIVGGEGHNAGEEGETTHARYLALAAFARERLGATEVTHRWSAHDPITADGLPYAGRLTPLSRHVWIATGFRKWGLTNGTAMAAILADRIQGVDNPYANLFDTLRFTPLRSAHGVAKEGLKDARHWIGDRLHRPASLDEVAPGDGRDREGGRPPGRGRTRRRRHAPLRLAGLHPSGLPRGLQPRRAKLGLPLPRVALRRRRHRSRGARGGPARARGCPSGDRRAQLTVL